jgi:hypothetical protein
VFEVTAKNPLLDIALELERIALEDEYFVKRKLYPNVDFYSGLIYQAMKFRWTCFRCSSRSRASAAGSHMAGNARRSRSEDLAATPGVHGSKDVELRAARTARVDRSTWRPRSTANRSIHSL